jgi:prophage regulatory protein
MVKPWATSEAKLLEGELRHARKLCELQARLLKDSDRLFSETKPAERLIRLPELLRLTGLSKRTIARLEGVGRFPSRRQLGLRAVGWAESAVNAWISDPANWRSAHPSYLNRARGSFRNE